jgi:hypothetical protein
MSASPRLWSPVVSSLWLTCGLLALAGLGCGGGNKIEGSPFQHTDSGIPDLVAPETSPADSMAADGGAADGGPSEAGADGPSADGPMVVLALSVDQPAENAIVSSAARFVPIVTVTVTAPAGVAADPLDTVKAELWSTGSAAMKISSTTLTLTTKSSGTGGVTSYVLAETPVDLSGLSSGLFQLRVTATTLGGVSASQVRSFRADSGPTIVITKPADGSSYKGSIAAAVQITDAIFAPVSNVTMSVGSHALVPTGPTGAASDQFSTLIDFNAYMPPLDGEQLFQVTAANSNGTTTTATVRFIIDNQGPTITNTTPVAGTIIGSLITIAATVTDPSNVLDASVMAVVAHGDESFTVKLDPDPTTAGGYLHQFDTRLLDIHDIYPTISFRASDLLGNQSSIGYTVSLDNTPPLADLDPSANFRIRVQTANTFACSWPFDPLGSDAVDDGELVAQLFDIRARVEDRGNTPFAGGADVIPISLVDPNRVELFVLDDATQPLVVDSDADGICDKINPLLVPTTTPMSSNDALLINMVPVAPSGASDMTPDPSIVNDPSLDCDPGIDTTHPTALCYTSDLTMAIPYSFSKEPAVWGLAPVVTSSPLCLGNQFDDFANNIHDGWACVAVRAADKLGNQQVSRVLRVCIDHDGVGNECPHRPLVAITNATPMVVSTGAPHGLASGDVVIVTRADVINANGRWQVTVSDPYTFSLDGSAADALRPGDGRSGVFVKASALPDCTGTQTSIQPVGVTAATGCVPWQLYPSKEVLTVL